MVKPRATHQSQICPTVGHEVQDRRLASDLYRVQGVRIERGRPKLGGTQVRRHEQQWTQRRLKEQVVVDADGVEFVPVDRYRVSDVLGWRLVALQCDAQADGQGAAEDI